VTFTSCATATFISFTAIPHQNYTVGGTYSAISYTSAISSNINCTSDVSYSLLQQNGTAAPSFLTLATASNQITVSSPSVS
jgi:hypothetical protein